jgi:2-oxo-3-hexenedioate decarboxylase
MSVIKGLEALAALDACHQISPFSARLSAFDLDDAYRVTAAIRRMREGRGEMPVGRKIGFTNRTAWPKYRPMWGYAYKRTVHNLAEIGDTFSLVSFPTLFEVKFSCSSSTDLFDSCLDADPIWSSQS